MTPPKKPSKTAIAASRKRAAQLLEIAAAEQEAANKAQLTANIAKNKAGLAALATRELIGAATGRHIDYDDAVTRINRQLHAGAGAVTRKTIATRKDLLYYFEFARNEDFGL